MGNQGTTTADFSMLRQGAEKLLKKKTLNSDSRLSETDLLKLIHELEVHQIELEMQNEELLYARAEAAKNAVDKYANLYDFVPSGLFTLSNGGKIIELNSAGAELLGCERAHLVNLPFVQFVSESTVAIFGRFLTEVFKSGTKKTCEVILSVTNEQSKDVLITGVSTNRTDQCFFTAIDITERKQAEMALKESEERFTKAFSYSPVGFNIFRLSDGRSVNANYSFLSFTGYSFDEVIGHTAAELNLIVDTVNRESWLKGLHNGESVRNMETCIRQKSGQLVKVLFSLARIEINGEPMGLIQMVDITDRLKSEDALRRSEEKFSVIYKKSPFASSVVRLSDGVIVDVNNAFENLFGYPGAEVIGERISNLRINPDVEKRKNLIERINKSGFVHDQEGSFYTKNGEKLIIHYNLDVVEIDHEKYVLNTAEDVSERREHEALRIKYDLITQFARDPMILVDFAGNIIEGNKAAVEFYGYTYDELKQLSIFDIRQPGDKQLTEEQMEKAKSGGLLFETLHRHKDGTNIFVEVSARGIEYEGKDILLSVIRDITVRKRAEEELQKSKEQLETLYRSMSEGLANHTVVYENGIAVDYIINDINPAYEAITGINRDFVVGKKASELYGTGKPPFLDTYARVASGGNPEYFETFFAPMSKHFSISVFSPGLGTFATTFNDITSRKKKDETLKKLNQTLVALSKSNLAMVRSGNELEYLKQVCDIVVEDCGYKMVWIGYAENDETKTIRPVASGGYNNNYIESIKLSWENSESGRGPTGVAIRTGKMSICNNMRTDPDFKPWLDEALKRGFAASIVFPLKTGDKVFGAITIYSSQPDSFHENEIQLLTELANDLSFGITTIRLREAQQLAEEALSKSYTKLEVLVKERTRQLQITNDLLNKEINIRKKNELNLKIAEEKYRTVADYAYNWEFWTDQHNLMVYCSPSCERITGYKSDDFFQDPKLFVDIIHPDDLNNFLDHKRKEHLVQNTAVEFQYRIIRHDGSERWMGHICQPIFDVFGDFIGSRGSNKDITERKYVEQLLMISNSKYELLSKYISDGLFICKNGCFEYVNNSLNTIFGYANQELVGTELIQLVLSEFRQDLGDFLSLKGELNQYHNFEIDCFRKDQSIIQVEILLHYVASERAIYGVIHDITEKKQNQKNIIKTIILTEEKERTYFSKELHDGLGPLLSTIKLYLQWSERPKTNKSRGEIIHLAEGVLEEALTTVKEISYKLSPHLLTYYGLTSAIQNFVDKLNEISAIGITFNCNFAGRFELEMETAIYRAVIECVNNTIKHSQASQITITITVTGNQLQVQYLDNGIGYDLQKMLSAQRGLGLFNLQNRIQSIGGKIILFSEPGHGVNYQILVNI